MLVSGRVDLKNYWDSSPSDTHWETYIVVTSFKYRENRGTPGIELFIRGLGLNKYPRDIRCINGRGPPLEGCSLPFSL